MKEKLKLRKDDQVLCYDGRTMMDVTTVKSVDKVNGTATLANGIVCKRESKVNNFKRADYMAKTFEGFIKKYDQEAKEVYEGWIFRQSFHRQMEELTTKIYQKMAVTGNQMKELANGEMPELHQYLLKAKNLFDNIREELL